MLWVIIEMKMVAFVMQNGSKTKNSIKLLVISHCFLRLFTGTNRQHPRRPPRPRESSAGIANRQSSRQGHWWEQESSRSCCEGCAGVERVRGSHWWQCSIGDSWEKVYTTISYHGSGKPWGNPGQNSSWT